jgi:ankyrin repeat protein
MHEPLWQAIETNDIASATKFLNLNDIEEQNMYDANGMSMLHKTAQLGLADMLMLLMERTGAKPDLVNAQLATPLHVACRSNKENVVKFLIGCGVEANTQDEHGQTPLLVCCIHGFAPLVSLLIESSIAGHLPEPIEIDTGDHRGLTPLNCAAIKGDFELVKILISRGQADVN